jgi:hypothetical protein
VDVSFAELRGGRRAIRYCAVYLSGDFAVTQGEAAFVRSFKERGVRFRCFLFKVSFTTGEVFCIQSKVYGMDVAGLHMTRSVVHHLSSSGGNCQMARRAFCGTWWNYWNGLDR